MGVPPNHPSIDVIFHEINHHFWGTPNLWKPQHSSRFFSSAKVLEAFDVVMFALLRPRRWLFEMDFAQLGGFHSHGDHGGTI